MGRSAVHEEDQMENAQDCKRNHTAQLTEANVDATVLQTLGQLVPICKLLNCDPGTLQSSFVVVRIGH